PSSRGARHHCRGDPRNPGRDQRHGVARLRLTRHRRGDLLRDERACAVGHGARRGARARRGVRLARFARMGVRQRRRARRRLSDDGDLSHPAHWRSADHGLRDRRPTPRRPLDRQLRVLRAALDPVDAASPPRRGAFAWRRLDPAFCLSTALRVDLFDFELPDELIALRPAQPRKSARLLVVDPNRSPEFRDRHVADLPDQLRAGDVIVLNDTRVIPARLLGMRVRGERTARVEILLHKRLAPDRWRAFARPAKRLSPGDRIVFGKTSGGIVCELQHLMATVESKPRDGEIDLAFDFHGAILDEAIERFGHMPLPPYIAQRRADDAQDRTDYQTVYARDPGAVAAPTAGLHLDPDLLDAIRARGVEIATVTLHVGPGTFLPVKAEDTS